MLNVLCPTFNDSDYHAVFEKVPLQYLLLFGLQLADVPIATYEPPAKPMSFLLAQPYTERTREAFIIG